MHFLAKNVLFIEILAFLCNFIGLTVNKKLHFTTHKKHTHTQTSLTQRYTQNICWKKRDDIGKKQKQKKNPKKNCIKKLQQKKDQKQNSYKNIV